MEFKSDKPLKVLRMAGNNKIDLRIQVEDIENIQEEELGKLIKEHLKSEIAEHNKKYGKYEWLKKMKDETERYETKFKPLILSLLSKEQQEILVNNLKYIRSVKETYKEKADEIEKMCKTNLHDLIYHQLGDYNSPYYFERNAMEIVEKFLEDIII